MAKIISSPWSIIRGSIAGTTYFTLPSGQIIARQRTRPTQPVSHWRTAIKNAFTGAVMDWSNLTAIQMQMWELWAASHTGRSGRHEMVAAKAFLRYLAELPIIPTPVVDNFDYAPEFTLSPSHSTSVGAPVGHITGISVKVQNNSAIQMFFMIEVSPTFGPQRHFWKGPWDVNKSVGMSVLAGALGTTDIVVGLAGDKVFVRTRGVTNGTAAHTHGHVVSASLVSEGIVQTTI